MPAKQGKTENSILTHAILIGLTPLIPVPIVDDLVKTQLQRRLVRRLAVAYQTALQPADVKVLADDLDKGCLGGCLLMALVLPLKLIFRKIFFFLEWKRAVDIVSRTYHHAYLLDLVLSEGWLAPNGPKTATEVRANIEAVCDRAPIKPVEHAVKLAFGQSKSLLKAAARGFQNSFKRLTSRSSESEVEQAIEQVEQEETTEITTVASTLKSALQHVPREHFQRMRDDLSVRLGVQRSKSIED